MYATLRAAYLKSLPQPPSVAQALNELMTSKSALATAEAYMMSRAADGFCYMIILAPSDALHDCTAAFIETKELYQKWTETYAAGTSDTANLKIRDALVQAFPCFDIIAKWDGCTVTFEARWDSKPSTHRH